MNFCVLSIKIWTDCIKMQRVFRRRIFLGKFIPIHLYSFFFDVASPDEKNVCIWFVLYPPIFDVADVDYIVMCHTNENMHEKSVKTSERPTNIQLNFLNVFVQRINGFKTMFLDGFPYFRSARVFFQIFFRAEYVSCSLALSIFDKKAARAAFN